MAAVMGGSLPFAQSLGGQAITLVVVGLAYVGLPLAREAVLSGRRVTGLDTSTPGVEELNRARKQVDHRATSDIRAVLDVGPTATTGLARLTEAEFVAICTPTPLPHDGGPDRSAVPSSAATLERRANEDRDRR